MYSNERGSRFSIIDILFKIIFAALFIFILVWLFQKKVPNMTPFYSNVFRENIKYMQEAGESYFTDDKMPKVVGETTRISLADMFDKKLILPFVDKDGNSCNQYDSYVSLTKTELGYELKTNLVCNGESDYTIKILGCHNYCKDNNCSKVCTKPQIIEYQYKKVTKQNVTSYSCPSGYKKDGKNCVKTILKDSKSAVTTKTSTKTDVKDSILVQTKGTKEYVQAKTRIVAGTPITEKVCKTTNKTVTEPCTKTSTEKVCTTTYKTVTESCTTNKTVAESCTKTKTEKVCTTTNVIEKYNCNCTTYRNSDGKSVTTCNTCTRTIPKEVCENKQVSYTDVCTKTVPTTTSCEKQVPVETCTDKPVSHTETCTKQVPVTECEEVTTTPTITEYYCPSGTVSEGSGKNLKCYKITSGTYHYECADKSYTLKSDNKCYKTTTGTYIELSCSNYKNYKLEGNKCNLYTTTKIKATAKKSTKNVTSYKWSKETELSGWTKTGKTRTVEGEEVCE